jgi:hypothetical protein
MRTLLASGVGLLALCGSARADVIVMDPTNFGQAIKDYTLQIQQEALQAKTYIGDQLSWAVQAKQYATQGQQYLTEVEQLAAFVHAPNLGAAMGLLNQAGLGNSLPVSPYAVEGLVSGVHYGVNGIPQITGVLNQLSGFTGSAYTTNHVYTPTDGSFASKETIANANSIAGMQGAAQAAVSDYQAHEGALQALETRLQTAKTPKDVQDIQAQIAVQQEWLASETGQMQAISVSYQAQRDAMAQRANESIDQGFDNFHKAAVAQGDGAY